MAYEKEKESIAFFMRRTYERGLTTSTGGNISCRCGCVMLITPSGKDKSSLSAEDIAVVDIATGENLTPEKKLSIETEMHRRIYLRRSDVNAVVHSHPTHCCLFSASSLAIDTTLIAESWYLLDRVEKVPYRLMGTEALADIVSEYASRGNNAMLLEKHGALSVGKTLLAAFDRMECLEQAARLTYMSRSVPVRGLDGNERIEISNMR